MSHDARRMLLIAFGVCALGASLVPAPLNAQVLYGQLVGDITDPSNAVIPGASVTATHVDTNQTKRASANAAGQYGFRELQPGTYTVAVSVPGFKEAVRTAVLVTVNNVTRVDLTMELGLHTERVVVTANAARLQGDAADVRKEISATEVTNLPLNNYRNYQSLIDLVPGASPSEFQNASVDTPSRSLRTNVNGVWQYGNTTRLDGALNVMPFLPHHSAYVAPQESVQTVSISTNSFDAEQGLAAGAAITVQTKSGTNQFHGVAFEYHRNSIFDARNFFAPAGSDVPKYLLNMFGGNLGGPILKEKLFFFVNYDGMRERQNYSNRYTVPTQAMRRGDFRGTGATIYDPVTGDAFGRGRTPFAGSVVPESRISSVAAKMLSLQPLPNIEGAGYVSNYYASAPRASDRDMYDFKVDWVRSSKNTLWFKYSLMNSFQDSRNAFGKAGGPGLSPDAYPVAARGDVRVQVGTVGGYYIVTPGFLIDGTIGWTRQVTHVRQPDFGTNFGLDVLQIPGTNGPDPRQSGKPYFIINGYTALGDTDPGVPIDRWDYTYTYTANASWTRGRHDIRFGGDISRYGINHWQPEINNGPRGTFTFTGGATALNGGAAPNRFNGFADFLLGLPQQVQKSLQFYDPMSTREWQVAAYFRDRWQVGRSLTLNVGLRWEYYPLMDRGIHGIERYDPDTNKVLIGGYGGVDWNAGTTVSKKLFAPRLGIAYRMGRQGVLRTGYGITFDPFPLGRPMRSPYPAISQLTLQGPNGYTPYGPILSGIPPMETPDITRGVIDIPPSYSTDALPAGLFRRGYIQSWNLTYERPLPFHLIAGAAYVGTAGVRITGGQARWPINNATVVGGGQASRPLGQKWGRYSETGILQPWAHSNYHALQATLDRSFAEGLMLKAVYTFSKSLGTGSAAFGIPELFYLNRTMHDFHRKHNLRVASMYALPWGPGRRWLSGGVAGKVLGGWQINGIFSSVSGTWFGLYSSSASLNTPGSFQTPDRVLPVVTKLGSVGSGTPFYDPTAFSPVTTARFGTFGNGRLEGPGMVNVDLGLFRNFRISEGKELQVRAEGFNVSNTPHFDNPFNIAGNVAFLCIMSAKNDQRTFRFGLRFSF